MLKLIGNYADFAVLAKTFGAAFVCLLVGVVIVIVCGKYKLFTRKNKLMHLFTCVYAVYIPLVMLLGGGAYFGVRTVEGSIHKSMDQFRPAISARTGGYARGLSAYVMKNQLISGELNIANLKEAVRAYVTSQPFFDEHIVMPERVKLFLSGFVAEAILSEVNKALSGVTKLDKETLSKLWNTDIAVLAEGGFVADLVQAQIDSRIKPVKSAVLTLWVLLMLLPFIETAISKAMERRLSGS